MEKKLKINDVNQNELYEKIEISDFNGLLKISGLVDCPDLNSIKDLVEVSEHILDIGSGTGRALEWLEKNKFPRKVFKKTL